MQKDLNFILEKIKKFRDDRDWMKYHDPKNMAISIVLEATELLEHFQWKTNKEIEEYIQTNREDIEDEMADVAVYLLEMADNMGVDLIAAMERKMKKNEKKYPVEKAKGSAAKYTELQ